MTNSTTKRSKCIHSLKYFCGLTCRAFPHEAFPAQKILSHRNGWSILADEWVRLSPHKYYSIIFDIMHYFKWGHMCEWGYMKEEDLSADYIELVQSACEELKADTPAYRAWIKKRCFMEAIENISFELCVRMPDHPHGYSFEHHFFVIDEMNLKLRYDPSEFNPDCCYDGRNVAEYKNRIIKLIPSAQDWDRDYWVDEGHIFDEIMRVHNVDYRCDFVGYLCLKHLIDAAEMKPNTIDLSDIVCFCNIELCSVSLIEAVWPGCDNNALAQMLIYAEKRAEQIRQNKAYDRVDMPIEYMIDVSYEMLSQCWLFEYVQQQLVAGTIDPQYITDTKRAIFNISMRANGC